MKNFFIVIGVILLILLISIGGKFLGFWGTAVKNTFKTPTEINNRVMNADNAIYNYEWFKQQEADIERLYKQEETHKKSLSDFKELLPKIRKDWSIWDRDEYSKLQANVTAQTDMVNRAIANYNAKSSMVTKNIFKDNLPSNLSRSWYAQKKLLFQ